MDVDELGIEVSTEDKLREYLLDCYKYSEKSDHPSTHNAAVLVRDEEIVLRGVNVLPDGVLKKPERFEGDNKHLYPNHAERDLIYKAAKRGISTDGLIMVMPWIPCIACANAMISSGIKKLIVHKQMIDRTRGGWQEELRNAVEILKEAGVNIVAYDGVVGAKAYMHGQEWDA